MTTEPRDDVVITDFLIADYLIEQLRARGVEHVFGVPGDFVIGLFDRLTRSELTVVNTCDEQGAGFAAEAYARVRGLGVVCVTYGVGGLKIANTTAQAYAEESPVVVISGAPGTQEQVTHALLHHKVREYNTQQKVFEQLTVASTVLDDPQTALSEIDRVLDAARRTSRPVYIELPRDMMAVPAARPHSRRPTAVAEDPTVLQVALDEAVACLDAATRPVILAGVEVHRFGLQEVVTRLADQHRIPIATTLHGKGVIGEQHPLSLGVYQGAVGRDEVRQYVEESDCLLLLGVLMTDMDLGIYTARLTPQRFIHATNERLAIGYHVYERVGFDPFVRGLARAMLRPRPPVRLLGAPVAPALPVTLRTTPITAEQVFARLGQFVTERTAVVTDVGDALFGAEDLITRRSTQFFSPAYYASLGFAVPGAIGVQLAAPTLRPLVLVGDGAFQMTGVELSTAVRFGLNPIVIVLNNGGYVTERYILDGPFNDVLPWNYARLPELLGAGKGFVVETEADLVAAMEAAQAHTESFCLLDVRFDPMDASPSLRRLSERLATRHQS